jgi:hypothetical protein
MSRHHYTQPRAWLTHPVSCLLKGVAWYAWHKLEHAASDEAEQTKPNEIGNEDVVMVPVEYWSWRIGKQRTHRVGLSC